jgi:hypothetical protein
VKMVESQHTEPRQLQRRIWVTLVAIQRSEETAITKRQVEGNRTESVSSSGAEVEAFRVAGRGAAR